MQMPAVSHASEVMIEVLEQRIESYDREGYR